MPLEHETVDLARTALAASGDLAYDWDLVTDTIAWLGPTADTLGPTTARRAATGKGWTAQMHRDDRPRRTAALANHLDRGAPYAAEFRIAADAAGYTWFGDRGQAERNARGQAMRLRGVLRRLDQTEADRALLERLAHYDLLTGLSNGNHLAAILDDVIQRCIRNDEAGVYLAIGVDRLGTINDVFGYQSADAVLSAVGARLTRIAEAERTVGRVQGDVFGMIVPKASDVEAAAISAQIIDAVSRAPVETPGGDLRTTVSAGYVTFPAQARTAADAMVKADGALRAAKRMGRNLAIPHRENKGAQRTQRVSLAVVELLQTALKEKRVHLAYQPVVDASTRRVSHYEGLLRIGDDFGGLVKAGAFMAVAEETGLVGALDRAALDVALQTLESHDDVQIAVNVSGLNTGRGSWLDLLVSRLADRREVANRLIVEITETHALADVDAAKHFVAQVRSLGCRVGIDDFGAGYTSFRHLRALDVDMVKIDGSFVQGLATDPDNRLFVRSLVGLARGFDLTTVAEFVESEDVASILIDEGLDQLQGYLFGEPSMSLPWLAGGRRAAES